MLHNLNNAHDESVSLIAPEHLLKQEWKVKLCYFSKEKWKFNTLILLI